MDRRLTWGEDDKLAIAQVKRYMSEAIGEAEDKIEVYMPDYTKRGYKNTDYCQELYFPTWKIPEEHPFVQAGVQSHERLFGKKPEIDKWTFSTNCVATAGRYKIPAIGFGPGDEAQAHAPNEFNRVEDLKICAAFYAMLPYILDENKV